MGNNGGYHPGNQHTHRTQVTYHFAVSGNVLVFQCQRPFKQNNGNRQRHDRKQQVAKQLVGIEHAKNGPNQYTYYQKWQNGWQPDAVGQILAPN